MFMSSSVRMWLGTGINVQSFVWLKGVHVLSCSINVRSEAESPLLKIPSVQCWLSCPCSLATMSVILLGLTKYVLRTSCSFVPIVGRLWYNKTDFRYALFRWLIPAAITGIDTSYGVTHDNKVIWKIIFSVRFCSTVKQRSETFVGKKTAGMSTHVPLSGVVSSTLCWLLMGKQSTPEQNGHWKTCHWKYRDLGSKFSQESLCENGDPLYGWPFSQ